VQDPVVFAKLVFAGQQEEHHALHLRADIE
jgi:hypothetical protein